MLYDLGMLAILAYTTFRGAARGMAWQLAAIASLLFCFLFATPLSLLVAPQIRLEPPLNRWVAMLGIYVVFSFACFATARLVRSWLESWKFEEYDRHLGAVFGCIKGLVGCLVLTFFTVCVSESSRAYVLQSRFGRSAGRIMHRLEPVMPAEFDAVLAPYIHRLDAGRQFVEGEPSLHGQRPGAGERDPVDPAFPGGFRGSSREQDPDEFDPTARDPDGPAAAPDLSESASGAIGRLVAAIRRNLPEQQDGSPTVFSEFEALLHGIPESVSPAALADWYADLTAGRDPDPETDAETPLDVRLWRQLHAAGMSLDRLPAPVRQRLREAVSE